MTDVRLDTDEVQEKLQKIIRVLEPGSVSYKAFSALVVPVLPDEKPSKPSAPAKEPQPAEKDE